MSGLDNLASWDQSLADLDYHYFDEEWEYASLGNFYNGTDKETGKPAEVLMAITVERRELLGSAVYGRRFGKRRGVLRR